MPKFITTMRVKLDAKRRVYAGEVLELSAKEAAPLLAAGAIEPHKEAKAAAAAAAEAEAKAKAEAEAKAAADAQALADAEAKAKAAAAAAGQGSIT